MLLTLYQLNLAGGPRLYYVVGPTSGWTTPTAAEIVAGTLSGGGTATAAGSMAAPTSTSTVTFPTTTGLTAGVGYTGAIVWWDGTNASNVVTTAWTQTSAGSYTLTADAASFTLAGIEAGLLFGRRLFADQQSYTLTGIDAGTLFGRRLTADQATFTLSGQDAGLIAGRRLVADQATFTLTGNDAGLVYAPAGVYTLTADTGSFALAGNDAGLIYTPLNNYVLTAETGGFSLSGPPADLLYSGAPPPAPAAPTGGGRSRKRRRYTVEIDGEEYDVASPAEAEAILKAKAEKAAQEAIERAQKAERRPGRKVLADARKSLALPTVTLPAAAPADLTAGINASLEGIRELYESTLRTIEIAALLRKQRQDEEDEEEVLLMLL